MESSSCHIGSDTYPRGRRPGPGSPEPSTWPTWAGSRGSLQGSSTREVGSCSQRFDLQPGPDEPMESLSKGNRQKLVLAQALLGPVGLLVLDEPFSGLDPVAHAALRELTNEAQSSGTAVLVSSHHSFPEQAGLRQLRIRDGQLAEIRRDATQVATDAGGMEVALLATDRASDLQRVAAIPGVWHARLEQSQGRLVLLTDRLQIDGVLMEVIAQGWSVRSVLEDSGKDNGE